MTRDLKPSEIEGLIIEYALIAAEDEVAEDDIDQTIEIEGLLDARVRGFLKEKKLSHRFVREMKMARLLVSRLHDGELKQIDSPEAREFIRQDFKLYPGYWG